MIRFSASQHSLEELWRVRAERTDEALVIADLLAQSQYNDALRPKLAAYYRYAASPSCPCSSPSCSFQSAYPCSSNAIATSGPPDRTLRPPTIT